MTYRAFYFEPIEGFIDRYDLRRMTGIEYVPGTTTTEFLNKFGVYPYDRTINAIAPSHSHYTQEVDFDTQIVGPVVQKVWTVTSRTLPDAKKYCLGEAKKSFLRRISSFRNSMNIEPEHFEELSSFDPADLPSSLEGFMKLFNYIKTSYTNKVNAIESASTLADIETAMATSDFVFNTGRGATDEHQLDPSYFSSINVPNVTASDFSLLLIDTESSFTIYDRHLEKISYDSGLTSPFEFSMSSPTDELDQNQRFLLAVEHNESQLIVAAFEVPNVGGNGNQDVYFDLGQGLYFLDPTRSQTSG